MHAIRAALLAVATCATTAQAQSTASAPPRYTLEQAVAAAGSDAPATIAASAAIEAAEQARIAASRRPNPEVQAQVENIAGSGTFGGLRSAETTLGVAVPIERGGKRGARVALAGAQLSRARIGAAVAAADLRLQVTQLYVGALVADRRVAVARDQARIAADALRVASLRVAAGRASPLERQRADVARINADAGVERAERLAQAARTNLMRRTGIPPGAPLDDGMLERLPAAYGPTRPAAPSGSLALAATTADVAIADAGIRIAQAGRVPDVTLAPALRRLEASNDTAAVFSVSLPIALFDRGSARIAQAAADRTRAEALARVAALDIAEAITDAEVRAANAAIAARTAAGPALDAAREAARIARIGYREGKFGQIELLDAERTLADTRLAAIDALADYQNARALLERLTAPAPTPETAR
ncbi:TolC family protein [Sphingomonas hankookensis]|uniref:Transporter n=1 Tax=Sphingomonas hengshuiensis TaxID=1609977 RepID=A0A2W4ZFL9_9SPHN|nr:MAG: transporter [Sphingomonas hengshuiensis]